MNQDPEKRARELLDGDLQNIDASTQEKLQAARHHALAGIHRTPPRRAEAWLSLTPARLVSATVMACSLLLVIGLWYPQSENNDQTLMSELPISSDLSPADLEIVEDLEFYEWLEAGGHAG